MSLMKHFHWRLCSVGQISIIAGGGIAVLLELKWGKPLNFEISRDTLLSLWYCLFLFLFYMLMEGKYILSQLNSTLVEYWSDLKTYWEKVNRKSLCESTKYLCIQQENFCYARYALRCLQCRAFVRKRHFTSFIKHTDL